MYTVGKLAAKFGLSRSTLLYYDSIGLLHPRERAQGEYRSYGPEQERRLERICLFRRAGLSLEEIKRVLEADSELSKTLEARLGRISEEIAGLREQQRLILGLLKNDKALAELESGMDKARWTELLLLSGFTEEDMVRWHRAFEKNAPEEHQAFLEYLGIPREEILTIRTYSGKDEAGSSDNGC